MKTHEFEVLLLDDNNYDSSKQNLSFGESNNPEQVEEDRRKMRTTTDGTQLDKHFGKLTDPSSRLGGSANQRLSTNINSSIGMQRGAQPNAPRDQRNSDTGAKQSPFKIFDSVPKTQAHLSNAKLSKPANSSNRFSFGEEQLLNQSPEHARNRNEFNNDQILESQGLGLL